MKRILGLTLLILGLALPCFAGDVDAPGSPAPQPPPSTSTSTTQDSSSLLTEILLTIVTLTGTR